MLHIYILLPITLSLLCFRTLSIIPCFNCCLIAVLIHMSSFLEQVHIGPTSLLLHFSNHCSLALQLIILVKQYLPRSFYDLLLAETLKTIKPYLTGLLCCPSDALSLNLSISFVSISYTLLVVFLFVCFFCLCYGFLFFLVALQCWCSLRFILGSLYFSFYVLFLSGLVRSQSIGNKFISPVLTLITYPTTCWISLHGEANVSRNEFILLAL